MSRAGFSFSYRDSYFDWRLIHGIDVDSVIRLTDVHAIEDCLHCIQHGNLGNETGLSIKNCVQVFRLLQLAIEYVAHLRKTHASLIASYDATADAADGWHHAACSYLDVGNMFLEECRQVSAMSVQRLEQVLQREAELEDQDRRYNLALDQLELEDQQARYFHFRKQRTELSWRHIHAVDLEGLVANVDTGMLDKVSHNLTYGNILGEDSEELTPHHFAQLVPLAQCVLDLMLYEANESGTHLERAMSRLQASCSGIPALTTATQEMRARVGQVASEAHSISQQAEGGAGAGAGGLGQAQLWNSGHRPATAAQRPPGSAHGLHSSSPPSFLSAPVPVPAPASAPGTVASAPVSVATAAAQHLQHIYDDLLTGAAGDHLVPVLQMQSHTSELHCQVDDLERDLRMERYKTDEMRRLLTDIRERLQGPAPGTPMRALSPQPTQVQLELRPSGEVLLGRERLPSTEQAAGPGPGLLSSPFATATAAAVQAGGGYGPAMHASTTQTAALLSSTIDEGAIRGEERRKTLMMLAAQIESVKQEAQKQLAARRHAASSSGSKAPGQLRKPRAGATPQGTSLTSKASDETLGGEGSVRTSTSGRGRPLKPGPKRQVVPKPPGLAKAAEAALLSDTDVASSPTDMSRNASSVGAGQPPDTAAAAAAAGAVASAAAPSAAGAMMSKVLAQAKARAAGPLAKGLARSSRLSGAAAPEASLPSNAHLAL